MTYAVVTTPALIVGYRVNALNHASPSTYCSETICLLIGKSYSKLWNTDPFCQQNYLPTLHLWCHDATRFASEMVWMTRIYRTLVYPP